MRLALTLAVAVVAIEACSDFAPPSELSRPLVIGVVSNPPIVGLGKSARLELIIATPEGQGEATGAQWSIGETIPGVPPIGSIVTNPDGSATYTAPPQLPPLPEKAQPVDTLAVQLELDGRSAQTLKAMIVADLPVPPPNPVISGLVLDGVATTQPLKLAANSTHTIETSIAGELSDDAVFAWYSSQGSIEKFTSNPTSIVTTEPGSGWLFFVVRDGRLGLSYLKTEVVVE